MSKRWLVVTALGVVVIAAISVLTLPSDKKYDATQTFMEIELDRRVPINSRLKADIVCLVPAGMTPFGYLKQHHPGKRIDREFDPESESKWFVIAINDQDSQARILDVNRSEIDARLDRIVCSRNLFVIAKADGNRRYLSATE